LRREKIGWKEKKADMIKPYKCTQCGSTDFKDVTAKRVRCAYCNSLYQLTVKEPTVIINKGANVVFGKHAKVEIRGDMEVEGGANVEILGNVSVLKGGKKQEFKLELIKAGENRKKQ
jgi:DNA-directed RNA polymerase subunit RPC12/RpoP